MALYQIHLPLHAPAMGTGNGGLWYFSEVDFSKQGLPNVSGHYLLYCAHIAGVFEYVFCSLIHFYIAKILYFTVFDAVTVQFVPSNVTALITAATTELVMYAIPIVGVLPKP